MRAQRYRTYGMKCPACRRLLEQRLERLPGVISAEADPIRGTTSVVYDARFTDETVIAGEIERSGFGVEPRRPAAAGLG